MKYRPEIDGLRAVAVVPVILFHGGFSLFSGGFVGVDVFFVISGYLITTIIVTELEQGRFSLLRFYERRARRILPALFFVMAACIPFAWMWMPPTQFKDFSQSVVAVGLFASNILFWREEGYFEPTADEKPLLHTWSLAVEEQYYMLFPLALLLLWGLGRNRVFWFIAFVAAVSLLLSEWGWRNEPSANFYLAPTRAWELLAGSICAFILRDGRALDKPVLGNMLSLAGVALIVGAIFFFDEHTPVPSLYALIPVGGTCLIILFAASGTWTARLLSLNAFVGIGLISYSAYLWHQPLLAFARIRHLSEPGYELTALITAASLVLAYFTWRFIEMPFRRPATVSRQMVFRSSVCAAALMLAFGAVGNVTSGSFRFDHESYARVTADEHRIRANHGLSPMCEGSFTLSEFCRTSEEPEIVLWGDSYAMHLMQALRASDPNLRVIQMTVSQCGPILGIASVSHNHTAAQAKQCIATNDKVLDYIRASKSLRYAVLSSPFDQYVGEDTKVMSRDGEIMPGNEVSLQSFKETLDALVGLGIRPVVVSPPPGTGANIGGCLARARWLGERLHHCDFDFERAAQEAKDVRELLQTIDREYDVIWLENSICADGRCRAAIRDTFIYRDSGHLSHEGSAFLGAQMKFSDMLKRRQP
jgi:peptidoglycan/LPS O-acetylase OafA/YrhL